MKPSRQMNKELNPAQRRIIKIQTVIDFEKEPKIRHKVLEIEDRLREIFPQAAFVGPVPENEPEEVPRVIFLGMESCSFSQIRMDYVVQVQKDRSREVNKVLRETEQKANRIFGAFQEHTGRAITRMGVIVHFVFPLAAKKSSLTYLHRTFFKADFTPPNLTELDFHFVQQSQAKYNINWLIKAVKVSDGAQRDAVLVLMDVNNYLEKTNKKIVSYPNDVIKKLFAFIKEQIRTKLPAVVRNQFTLE